MTMRRYIILIFLSALSACGKKVNVVSDSPLVVVIKLQSAESLEDFSTASKYIDTKVAYSAFANDTLSAEDAWRDIVRFNHALAQDKRFTNDFKYYQFDISEEIRMPKAQVSFRSNDVKAKLMKLTYDLEFRDSVWIVVNVAFQRSRAN